MTSAPLPDAGANWVDRHAPEGLKPWLKLGRFDRPIGIWLLLLPGWQGIALALAQYRQAPGLYDLWLFVGFAVGLDHQQPVLGRVEVGQSRVVPAELVAQH